ncbi:DUF1453 domain-containing protein [Luteibacter aegosomatissinici]|uniref:DUF1453 domain-containing protein n=1 Tax=Luteibacter aegosomatissinici TaxID=2911539 RepID=UPI001FF8B014|nr:DUF1453 domain-containing protein [Luteibacter aegosomatissinici]UPG94811.1 DUF1453 domain-containing protein [Luteibacter aegosomatissinici]
MLLQAAAATTPALVPVAMAGLMVWVVYRRVRRNFGRQTIHTRKMAIRVGLFVLVSCLLMTIGFASIRLAEGALAGLIVGAALGMVGLKLTRFELGTGDTDAYIPNPWIGAALTALLIGRMAYRFIVVGAAMHAGAAAPAHGPAPGDSPLTMAVVGLTLGYYLAYYAGILVHHRRFKRQALGQAA